MKSKIIVVGLSILIFVLSVVTGISMAYATVTSKLQINGTATMNSGNWSIHFGNLRKAELKGTAKENSSPKLHSDTTGISNFDVDLYQSEDSVTYTFDVINDGGLDAYVSSITIPKPICIGENEQDSKLVCDNLSYNLTYSNGGKINVGDSLMAETSKTLKLTLKYNGKDLPSSQVEITGLGITIIYSQK